MQVAIRDASTAQCWAPPSLTAKRLFFASEPGA